MTQFPTHPPQVPGSLVGQPHRGGTILTLGILALVFTFVCGFGWILGIIAWVMANKDLQLMASGLMDRSGEGNTVAGRIMGIISVVIGAIGAVLGILWLVFGLAIIGIGAAGAGGAP